MERRAVHGPKDRIPPPEEWQQLDRRQKALTLRMMAARPEFNVWRLPGGRLLITGPNIANLGDAS